MKDFYVLHHSSVPNFQFRRSTHISAVKSQISIASCTSFYLLRNGRPFVLHKFLRQLSPSFLMTYHNHLNCLLSMLSSKLPSNSIAFLIITFYLFIYLFISLLFTLPECNTYILHGIYNPNAHASHACRRSNRL